MKELDAFKSNYLTEKAKKVAMLSKRIEILDRKILAKPKDLEKLMGEKKETINSLEREYISVQNDKNVISQIIQTKQGQLSRFSERQAAINRMAFLLGKIGMQEDAELYDNFAETLEASLPRLQSELEDLTNLHRELLRRSNRTSDRDFRRTVDKDLIRIRSLWRRASRR